MRPDTTPESWEKIPIKCLSIPIAPGYGSTKYPDRVYQSTKTALAAAKRQGKPLFYNLNIYDPHVGWYGWGKLGPEKETINHPGRIYTADEMPYPDFFPPIPAELQTSTMKGGTEAVSMQDELAAYFTL